MILLWVIGASIIVSLISLIGILTLLFDDKYLNKILILLISLSAGGLIGGAFLHLLPETLEKANTLSSYVYILSGFLLFFILERYLLWHHCHDGECPVHPFSYLNLIGDGIHNLFDGLVIGASFTINIHFGITTTLAIILHEIPQEIGDFGVLVYGGMKKHKALFYNFLSAIVAILGSLAGYYFSGQVESFSKIILPFAAGGFIYIAGCDLIPEIHKQTNLKRTTLSTLFFIIGIALMLIFKIIFKH